MKRINYFLTTIILLITIPFTSYAQDQEPALHTFKGTAWHIEQIITTKDGSSQTQYYKSNENIIKIAEDATYQISNFMGKDTTLTGFWVETQNVISLSTVNGDAYFWVFEIASKNLNEVRLNYIHFKEDGESIELLMKPYQDSLQNTDNQVDSLQTDTNPKITNVEGDWVWKYESKMEIQLEQIKTRLKGIYTYTSKDGVKTEYFLSGKITGQKAEITILDVNDALLAKASLIKVGDTLEWKNIVKENNKTFLTIPNVNFGKVD